MLCALLKKRWLVSLSAQIWPSKQFNTPKMRSDRDQRVTINCDVTGLTFWYGSHSQGHSNLEIIHSPSQPAASMDRVIKVSHVDGPHSHADHTDDLQGAPKQSYLDSCC